MVSKRADGHRHIAGAVGPVVEQLEQRELLSASIKAGILRVGGTSGNDAIVVTQAKSNVLTVKINGKSQRLTSRGRISGISINAGAGDDRISISGKITAPTTILGGDGNDTITGGAGMDLIKGGAGNDVIHGRAGDDLLFGDAGDDSLFGEAGNDTIGGDANEVLWFKGQAQPDFQTGNDVVDGGDGNDWLLGGMNSDTIKTQENGQDTFTGGNGTDIIDARADYTFDAQGNPTVVNGTQDTITDASDPTNIVPQQDNHHELDLANNHPAGLTGTDADLQVHIHAHLHIYVKVKGHYKELEIPVGVGDFFLSPTFHTHTDDGTLHMHDLTARSFHLTEFFQNLSMPLSHKNLGSLVVDRKHPLKMLVKHQGQTKYQNVTKSLGDYALQGIDDPAQGDVIKLLYG